MTTYTAILASEIDTDSPITVDLMTKIRDNPIAITEGAAGAPRIQLAAMDTGSVDTTQIVAAAVGRSQIATALATTAGNLNDDAHTLFTLNDYSFFPMVHTNTSSGAVQMTGHTTDGGSGAAPRFSLYKNGATLVAYDVDHRYITTA